MRRLRSRSGGRAARILTRHRGSIVLVLVAAIAVAVLLVSLTGMPAGNTRPPAQAAERPVHVVPPTIDFTGTTDVTEELNEFLAGVSDGSTVVFSGSAKYRIEGVILLSGRSDLVIEGNGATFFATTDGSAEEPPDNIYGRNWPRHRAHWVVHRGRQVVLRELVIRGANPDAGPHNGAYVPALEAQHGVELAGVVGALVEGCTITDTYGDLVSVTNKARDVVVRKCTLERSGRQGVTVDQAVGVLIEDNLVSRIGRSAFDLEPARDDWLIERVQITGNIVGRANGVFVAAYGQGSGLRDIEISSNTLRDEPLAVLVKAPEGHRRHNIRVIKNTSDKTWGSPLGAVRFTRVTGVEVRGNTAPIAPYRTGDGGRVVHSGIAVTTRLSCDVLVSGNRFPGATTVHDSDAYSCSPETAAGKSAVEEPEAIETDGPGPATTVTTSPRVSTSDGIAAGGTTNPAPGDDDSTSANGEPESREHSAGSITTSDYAEATRVVPDGDSSPSRIPAAAAAGASALVLVAALLNGRRRRPNRPHAK